MHIKSYHLQDLTRFQQHYRYFEFIWNIPWIWEQCIIEHKKLIDQFSFVLLQGLGTNNEPQFGTTPASHPGHLSISIMMYICHESSMSQEVPRLWSDGIIQNDLWTAGYTLPRSTIYLTGSLEASSIVGYCPIDNCSQWILTLNNLNIILNIMCRSGVREFVARSIDHSFCGNILDLPNITGLCPPFIQYYI